MKHFIQVDNNGMISHTMTLPNSQPDPIEPEWQVYSGGVKPKDLNKWLFVNGELTARQVLPQYVVTNPNGETHYDWTGLPTGTSIEVIDMETQVSFGVEQEVNGAITIEFTEVGDYFIRIIPPDLSYIEQDFRVTI